VLEGTRTNLSVISTASFFFSCRSVRESYTNHISQDLSGEIPYNLKSLERVGSCVPVVLFLTCIIYVTDIPNSADVTFNNTNRLTYKSSLSVIVAKTGRPHYVCTLFH
jgi:hypothetical protein